MSWLADASRAALAASGPLATRVAAFTPRVSQQDLSAAVAEAFEQRDMLLAEAGTGTGKTFAYLVPVLLSGCKTIISTGTRALQDQLYYRDLPRVRDALAKPVTTALLKGRANYLCKYRFEHAKGGSLPLTSSGFDNREQFADLVAWSGRTQLGDLAEVDTLSEDSPWLPQVTSTADNCLGGECPFWSDCFVVRARQRAQAADIVVVNHHLLLADLALKQEGFGEILPGAQAFIVDEAHQLPELAVQFFGEVLSTRALTELARDGLTECKDIAGALALMQPVTRELEVAVRAARAAMTRLPPRSTQWRAWQDVAVRTALEQLATTLTQFVVTVTPLREASAGLQACHLRAIDCAARLERWCVERCYDDEFDTSDDDVRWYELTPAGFRLQRTPLDVAAPLRAHRERTRAAWVFTSATLAVDGNFDHIAERLGLSEPRTLVAPSPFAWSSQTLCYLPPRMPAPASPGYGTAVIAALRPVLVASQGRAFVLFASHRALREVALLLRSADEPMPWPLFVQGEAPRPALLQQFRESGNGVLLGAASFREGVDVTGAALSVVVIDKLPFAALDEPVLAARLEAIRRHGGNPFRDDQLPQAVIALKQGVGRLIRSEQDRGVLVLCDPRLLDKSYGQLFLDSLPPFPLTRNIADVEAFFASEPGELQVAESRPLCEQTVSLVRDPVADI